MKGFLPYKSHGLGLVELLVALALGLIISAAVMQVFLTSRSTYRMQDAMSRVQENGRFAVGYIANEIRMAGYTGCGNLGSVAVNDIIDPVDVPSGFDFDFGDDTVVRGHDNVSGTNTWSAKAATDVIELRRASNTGVKLIGNMTAANANIQLSNNAPNFVAGDALFISDCSSADLFRATSVSAGVTTITVAHANDINIDNRLSKAYGADAEVMAFEYGAFFVRDTGRTTPRGQHISSLYLSAMRAGSNTSTEVQELVEGVEDMQLEYGIDTSGDRSADEYRTATTVSDWARVVSIRINLLMRSTEENVASVSDVDASQRLRFNNADVQADGFLRQVFSSVVTIRNRVP
jgi:type IV pilus assembly protein PilW